MTKHTPGPWHVHIGIEGECLLGDGQYVDGADGDGVAYAQRSPADARLIAAAPDLLAALQAALYHIEQICPDSHDVLKVMMRAAIAKATQS